MIVSLMIITKRLPRPTASRIPTSSPQLNTVTKNVVAAFLYWDVVHLSMMKSMQKYNSKKQTGNQVMIVKGVHFNLGVKYKPGSTFCQNVGS